MLPSADAILVAPATLSTLTKWADGHADTLALGLITEAIGLGLPLGDGGHTPHPPKHSNAAAYPWHAAVAALPT